jgi:hypothetical protein
MLCVERILQRSALRDAGASPAAFPHGSVGTMKVAPTGFEELFVFVLKSLVSIFSRLTERQYAQALSGRHGRFADLTHPKARHKIK